MITPPCKGCQERRIGCHASCEAYQNYSKIRAEILVKKQIDNLATDSHFQRKRPKKKTQTPRKRR